MIESFIFCPYTREEAYAPQCGLARYGGSVSDVAKLFWEVALSVVDPVFPEKSHVLAFPRALKFPIARGESKTKLAKSRELPEPYGPQCQWL